MKKILVVVSTPFSAERSLREIRNFTFLEKFKDTHEIILLNRNRNPKTTSKIFETITGVKVNRYISTRQYYWFPDWQQNKPTKKYDSWEDFYTRAEVESGFDKVFFVGGPIYSNSSLDARTISPDFHKTSSCGSYASRGTCIMTIFLGIKMSQGCTEKHYYVADPLELGPTAFERAIGKDNIWFKRYHTYTGDTYERTDIYQYKHNKVQLSKEKIYDFLFGYTVMANYRKNIVEKILPFIDKIENKKILVKDSFKKIDTFVKYEDYLDLIEQSKYTVVVPSYDVNAFSGGRMIEGLYRNCLPLIHPDTKYQQFADSFGIPHEKMEEINIKNMDSLFDESKRLELLEYFKSKICVIEKIF